MLTIKKITQSLALAAFILTTQMAQAQTDKHDDFRPSKNEGWMVNLEKAYERSKATNKPILANFTGSDWCGWCKRLKREVFEKPEFKTWAKNNVILLELDYPRSFTLPKAQVEQNNQLQRAFRVQGFPTIWMFKLNKDEKGSFEIQPYGQTGYQAGGPKSYIQHLDKMIDSKNKG